MKDYEGTTVKERFGIEKIEMGYRIYEVTAPDRTVGISLTLEQAIDYTLQECGPMDMAHYLVPTISSLGQHPYTNVPLSEGGM